MNELKPCPFCGGKAKLHISAGSTKKKKLYYVMCDSNTCRVYPQTYVYSKIGYATRAWNRRADNG